MESICVLDRYLSILRAGPGVVIQSVITGPTAFTKRTRGKWIPSSLRAARLLIVTSNSEVEKGISSATSESGTSSLNLQRQEHKARGAPLREAAASYWCPMTSCTPILQLEFLWSGAHVGGAQKQSRRTQTQAFSHPPQFVGTLGIENGASVLTAENLIIASGWSSASRPPAPHLSKVSDVPGKTMLQSAASSITVVSLALPAEAALALRLRRGPAAGCFAGTTQDA
ncbi:hypothetical protein AAFF_G00211420 [Aldrovandia affinis]|uniref:Uncharacterized protein n=1 Tax=Aldrovandia affinis TaxID=143900 RepID=A0AAD7SWM9_9TELE|nr:hypothetical protein AAFF_G00211420 [Aldrovandia affinis]